MGKKFDQAKKTSDFVGMGLRASTLGVGSAICLSESLARLRLGFPTSENLYTQTLSMSALILAGLCILMTVQTILALREDKATWDTKRFNNSLFWPLIVLAMITSIIVAIIAAWQQVIL